MTDVMDLYRSKVIMAPMAGVNVASFCHTLMDLGCGCITTGLLTSHGLARGQKKTMQLLDNMPPSRGDFALIGQVFGGEPEVMADAAAVLQETGMFRAIDINMGCPAPKVLKGNGGVALMAHPDRARAVVRAVVNATSLPVTVKMRLGMDDDSINFLDIARMAVDNGAAALCLHPRTRRQRFTGHSDWSQIALLKETVAVPVVGSGDIWTPEDARAMIDQTGCDAVMCGRGAQGEPWLIGRARTLLDTRAAPPPPTPRQRILAAVAQLDCHVRHIGPERGVPTMRGFLGRYIKGLPNAADIRARINRAPTLEDTKEILFNYLSELERSEPV
jgi:tRNA-dihydrouridine synthase B